jgi:hypothetical protein
VPSRRTRVVSRSVLLRLCPVLMLTLSAQNRMRGVIPPSRRVSLWQIPKSCHCGALSVRKPSAPCEHQRSNWTWVADFDPVKIRCFHDNCDFRAKVAYDPINDTSQTLCCGVHGGRL